MVYSAALLALLLGTNPYLSEARALYEALDYPAALARLQLASEVPESSPSERRESFDLLARTLIAMGRADEAETVYLRLLSVDAQAPGPRDASPKVKAAYDRAKQKLYPPDFLRLVGKGSGPGAQLVLVDPWGQVASLEAVGLSGERQSLLPPSDGVVDLDPGQWRVVARDEQGRAMIEAGATLPSRAELTKVVDPQPVVRSRWAAWVLTGTAVALGATGAGLAFASAADSRSAGRAEGALETSRLDDAARRKALAANVLVGAALAGGAAAVLVWVF